MSEQTSEQYAAAERFVSWLAKRIVSRARGSDRQTIDGKPSDRFWLGRLAPTAISARSGGDERGERLEPCQVGFRVRLANEDQPSVTARVAFYIWRKSGPGRWQKLDRLECDVTIGVSYSGVQSFGSAEFSSKLRDATGRTDLGAEVRVEQNQTEDGREAVLSLVNTSSLDDGADIDPRFYEVEFEVAGLVTQPFFLDSLEDTFRYDRSVPAYGINCGVDLVDGRFRTVDVPVFLKPRPAYWGADADPPNLGFESIAADPIAAGEVLVERLDIWGAAHWSKDALSQRREIEGWSDEMWRKALEGAEAFTEEVARIRRGVELLRVNGQLRRAFVLMNRAMLPIGERKGYSGWRPFQFGFLLANIPALVDEKSEADVVDIVWFATGGGKTETYLGLIVTAAFLDRLRGKFAGVTAWSRFPLRMLSLQQMQRFADAMASSERLRREENIGGSPFSVGFLVGQGASPNKIRRPEQDNRSMFDPDDPSWMPKYRMLQQCPFCESSNVAIKFDFEKWTLEHRCTDEACDWPEEALPFFIVDEEVFRFLPTVIVGTLDKAASIGMQQAMRGLVGAPRGLCSRPGHGFTYNSKSDAPHGCLVPDCMASAAGLPFEEALFPPTFRLQDELHLLRDSLGAVDAHYEALLDGLQLDISGRLPKILASSATLSGYEKQSRVLYRRRARVFPQPAPSPEGGFWSRPTTRLMREYLAIAPRGATVEFAVDRLLNELQCAVRDMHSDPESICAEIGVDPVLAPFLLSQYGTNVVYGNTLRDLDAVSRSSGTQLVDIVGPVNEERLTGRTDFDKVSEILDRLQKTDEALPFEERVHFIMGSSMMSHGVDVDRLNTMVVLGLPLTTAEFIQATARVGRRWPALVFVVHKMGRERDAGVYRSFEKFVDQGDRFVEPIPITGRSRRVLEQTLSGLGMGRLLHVHAPAAADRFTTVRSIRNALKSGSLDQGEEADAIIRYLDYDPTSEAEHIGDIASMLERFFDRVRNPGTVAHEWFGKIWARTPMRSLRDVEDQVPVILRRDE